MIFLVARYDRSLQRRVPAGRQNRSAHFQSHALRFAMAFLLARGGGALQRRVQAGQKAPGSLLQFSLVSVLGVAIR